MSKIQPPCYDKKNRKDCPDREWCKEVGRSKCLKWVEYEKLHSEEKSKENEIKKQQYVYNHNPMIEKFVKIKERRYKRQGNNK